MSAVFSCFLSPAVHCFNAAHFGRKENSTACCLLSFMCSVFYSQGLPLLFLSLSGFNFPPALLRLFVCVHLVLLSVSLMNSVSLSSIWFCFVYLLFFIHSCTNFLWGLPSIYLFIVFVPINHLFWKWTGEGKKSHLLFNKQSCCKIHVEHWNIFTLDCF